MHRRCRASPYYVKRGIRVCAEWADFEAFRVYVVSTLGELPANKTLDRTNNNKGYEPGNLRFATMKEQARNRTSNRAITNPATGETLLLCEWAERLGIKTPTLSRRLDDYGWTIEQALSLTVDRRGGWSARRARHAGSEARPTDN